MRTHSTKPLLLAAALWSCVPLVAEEPERATGPAPYPERLQWWGKARFGMFIHWGPVSLAGTEIGWSRGEQVPISEYDSLCQRFNPTNFNASEWATLARFAGMKYVVLTTKHHDGFCLWDTRQTDYNIMRTPFGRDVVKELALACKREGLVFCAYHSICDWRHPDYPLGSPGGKTSKPNADMARYNRYLKGQLSELIRNYGPLGVLWFDGEWESPWTTERGRDLYDFCRALQPSLIINNRVSRGREGMSGVTAQTVANPGDYDTPEQQIGAYQDTRPWETCMTICQQWSWKPNDTLKSLAKCLQTLVRCAGGDGNLLLNVGPMPDGRIEQRQVERLQEIGAWLAQYGPSIYGTRGGPWKPTTAFASTRKGNTVFLHVFRWKGDTITLPNIPRKILTSSVLTGGKALTRQAADRLLVTVSTADQKEIDTVVRLELDDSAMTLPASSVPAQSE